MTSPIVVSHSFVVAASTASPGCEATLPALQTAEARSAAIDPTTGI
ncbi:hypothetical protein IU443_12920 [Nocardia farcinica]|nr:hypothetical protein [Nocardia farcinica]MBF6250198.1 hypothetical protein [Nocardia farcinica]MBF6390851.1 hypothetical protein [Nocardia farcinica]